MLKTLVPEGLSFSSADKLVPEGRSFSSADKRRAEGASALPKARISSFAVAVALVVALAVIPTVASGVRPS